MADKEKTYCPELTEAEIYAISEGIGNIYSEAVMSGNNIELLMEMISNYADQKPHLTKDLISLAKNYVLINQGLLVYQNPISWIVSKAEKISKTI